MTESEKTAEVIFVDGDHSHDTPSAERTLHDLTDDLTQLLDDAIRIFANVNVDHGSAARIQLEGQPEYLAWRKIGGEWRLGIERPSGEITDLAKASRRLRVLAASHLDALLIALREAQRADREAVINAHDRVREFLKRGL